MKKLFLFFLLAGFFCMPFFSQQVSMKNPIYLFDRLAECSNERMMEETCSRYGLEEEPDEDGFKVYSYHDGTILKFKVDSLPDAGNVPVVRAYTNMKKKRLEEILLSLGYVKSDKRYVKGNKVAPSHTVCEIVESGLKDRPLLLNCTLEFKK